MPLNLSLGADGKFFFSFFFFPYSIKIRPVIIKTIGVNYHQWIVLFTWYSRNYFKKWKYNLGHCLWTRKAWITVAVWKLVVGEGISLIRSPKDSVWGGFSKRKILFQSWLTFIFYLYIYILSLNYFTLSLDL